jgi:hypothetical protein
MALVNSPRAHPHACVQIFEALWQFFVLLSIVLAAFSSAQCAGLRAAFTATDAPLTRSLVRPQIRRIWLQDRPGLQLDRAVVSHTSRAGRERAPRDV